MTLERHPKIDRLSSSTLHEGKVFRLLHEEIRLPSGLRQAIDVVEHPGAVAVLAVDDEQRVLLVRQYRHALSDWTVELPAGRLERDEEPEMAARRELEEETGFVAKSWKHYRTIVPAPGFCSERIHIFLARGLREVEGGGLPADADEEIEITWMTPQEILQTGLRDAKTLLCAALLAVD